jgi:uncharacterized membrane protein
LEFLAGLHPLVVHFPIAFLFLYIFLEIINIFINNKNIEKLSILLLLFGVLGGVISVLTGNQTYQLMLVNPSITQYHFFLIEKHELYASVTIWYFLGLLIYKMYALIKKKNQSLLRYLFVIFALGGAVLLYKTADFGGRLVYGFGIGTDLIN